jgi:hypothetical protein
LGVGIERKCGQQGLFHRLLTSELRNGYVAFRRYCGGLFVVNSTKLFPYPLSWRTT